MEKKNEAKIKLRNAVLEAMKELSEEHGKVAFGLQTIAEKVYPDKEHTDKRLTRIAKLGVELCDHGYLVKYGGGCDDWLNMSFSLSSLMEYGIEPHGIRNVLMKYLFVLLIVLVGCTDINSPEIKQKNARMLAGQGDLIGTLSDGRELRCYKIDRGTTTHYVYMIGGANTITVNRYENKQTAVEVVIDGIPYVPKQKQ